MSGRKQVRASEGEKAIVKEREVGRVIKMREEEIWRDRGLKGEKRICIFLLIYYSHHF